MPTLGELGATLNVVVDNGEHTLARPAPLDSATNNDISFYFNPRQKDLARQTKAVAVITSQKLAPDLPASTQALVVADPRAAMVPTLALFAPEAPTAGIHTSAVIHPKAKVHASAYIGPFCYVGEGVEIGAACILHSHNSIEHSTLGQSVVLAAGAVVGCAGFGSIPGQPPQAIPHVGRVVIEDHVQLGAHTTVDRATMAETRIGANTLIDNQVQIAHNVTIGPNCLIAAQVGLAGSCTLAEGVILGGQVGIADGITLATGTMVAGGSGVTKSVTEPNTMIAGTPAVPVQMWRQQIAAMRRLIK